MFHVLFGIVHKDFGTLLGGCVAKMQGKVLRWPYAIMQSLSAVLSGVLGLNFYPRNERSQISDRMMAYIAWEHGMVMHGR